MFGMEMAQENIQASLGNVKKPDFPEQSFYSECTNAEHEVEQKEQGMAPSNGPCPVTSQKHLNAVEATTEKKLAGIKEEADKMGEEKFNAFDELENYLFSSAVGGFLRVHADNIAIGGAAGAGIGGLGGAYLAHRKAKKAGIARGTSEYKKLMAKRALLGAATGTALGATAGGALSHYSHKKDLYKGTKAMGIDTSNSSMKNYYKNIGPVIDQLKEAKIVKSARDYRKQVHKDAKKL